MRRGEEEEEKRKRSIEKRAYKYRQTLAASKFNHCDDLVKRCGDLENQCKKFDVHNVEQWWWLINKYPVKKGFGWFFYPLNVSVEYSIKYDDPIQDQLSLIRIRCEDDEPQYAKHWNKEEE